MKRAIAFFLVFFILTGLTGCDALQKKFTRKNTTVKKPRFWQAKKYTRKPSPELYKQHYAYWSSWQEEVIQVIGENHKKDVRCVEEALGHLRDMQNILVAAKAETMDTYIDKMESAKYILSKGELSPTNRDDVRRTLERVERGVKKDFCYARVKDCLRTSFDDEK